MSTVVDTRAELAKLHERLCALEASGSSEGSVVAATAARNPPPATDDFACRMMTHAVAAGFRQTTFTRVPSTYYDWALTERRRVLHAASTAHLTKSVVLRDHKYTGEHQPQLAHARYVCVVVQYGRKVNTDLLARAVSRPKANFRLAEDCEALTSYPPNAVTPLAMTTPMPVVVDARIAQLVPATFWLGGGEVDLKWRVEWDDFQAAFNPLVANVSARE